MTYPTLCLVTIKLKADLNSTVLNLLKVLATLLVLVVLCAFHLFAFLVHYPFFTALFLIVLTIISA